MKVKELQNIKPNIFNRKILKAALLGSNEYEIKDGIYSYSWGIIGIENNNKPVIGELLYIENDIQMFITPRKYAKMTKNKLSGFAKNRGLADTERWHFIRKKGYYLPNECGMPFAYPVIFNVDRQYPDLYNVDKINLTDLDKELISKSKIEKSFEDGAWFNLSKLC